jgi:antitoxin VapB
MQNSHYVSLSTNGQEQILTIPQELALPVTEVVIRKEGNRLIVEPITPSSLLSLLTSLPDIEEDFPELDEKLLPLNDIEL